MWKIIALLLVVAGCIWLYQNQDTLLQKAQDAAKTEKTIYRVNNASQIKERAIIDAQNKAMEY